MRKSIGYDKNLITGEISHHQKTKDSVIGKDVRGIVTLQLTEDGDVIREIQSENASKSWLSAYLNYLNVHTGYLSNYNPEFHEPFEEIHLLHQDGATEDSLYHYKEGKMIGYASLFEGYSGATDTRRGNRTPGSGKFRMDPDTNELVITYAFTFDETKAAGKINKLGLSKYRTYTQSSTSFGNESNIYPTWRFGGCYLPSKQYLGSRTTESNMDLAFSYDVVSGLVNKTYWSGLCESQISCNYMLVPIVNDNQLGTEHEVYITDLTVNDSNGIVTNKTRLTLKNVLNVTYYNDTEQINSGISLDGKNNLLYWVGIDQIDRTKLHIKKYNIANYKTDAVLTPVLEKTVTLTTTARKYDSRVGYTFCTPVLSPSDGLIEVFYPAVDGEVVKVTLSAALESTNQVKTGTYDVWLQGYKKDDNTYIVKYNSSPYLLSSGSSGLNPDHYFQYNGNDVVAQYYIVDLATKTSLVAHTVFASYDGSPASNDQTMAITDVYLGNILVVNAGVSGSKIASSNGHVWHFLTDYTPPTNYLGILKVPEIEKQVGQGLKVTYEIRIPHKGLTNNFLEHIGPEFLGHRSVANSQFSTSSNEKFVGLMPMPNIPRGTLTADGVSKFTLKATGTNAAIRFRLCHDESTSSFSPRFTHDGESWIRLINFALDGYGGSQLNGIITHVAGTFDTQIDAGSYRFDHDNLKNGEFMLAVTDGSSKSATFSIEHWYSTSEKYKYEITLQIN